MVGEKILHLTEGHLEDPRVLKAAMTGKNAGNRVYFCGEKPSKVITKDLFEETIWIKFPKWGRIATSFIPKIDRFWPWFPYPKQAMDLKNQIKRAVEKIRPDIIHAHNIFVAHHAISLGIPMVLDDHELYSVNVLARSKTFNYKGKLQAKIKNKMYKKWEEEIGEKFPIITTSKQKANHHRKYCKNVFVVPNYPRRNFIKTEYFNEATKNNLVSAYIGKDIGKINGNRNIQGFHEIFLSGKKIGKLVRIGVSDPNNEWVKSFGYVHFSKAFEIMQKNCHIGIVPWQPNWFHRYISPNKPYEYAHCGLWVATINDLTNVIDDFGENCDSFSNYDELVSILEYYNENPNELNAKRKKLQNYAQKNFIWEKNESQILDAYKIA